MHRNENNHSITSAKEKNSAFNKTGLPNVRASLKKELDETNFDSNISNTNYGNVRGSTSIFSNNDHSINKANRIGSVMATDRSKDKNRLMISAGRATDEDYRETDKIKMPHVSQTLT